MTCSIASTTGTTGTTGTEGWYYYITDAAGSVVAVTDSNENIVNRYDYDAFGNLIKTNSFENVPRSKPSMSNCWILWSSVLFRIFTLRVLSTGIHAEQFIRGVSPCADSNSTNISSSKQKSIRNGRAKVRLLAEITRYKGSTTNVCSCSFISDVGRVSPKRAHRQTDSATHRPKRTAKRSRWVATGVNPWARGCHHPYAPQSGRG